MKTSLLSLALLASAAFAANAETPYINYGYCGDDISTVGVPKSGIVQAVAIEIPASQMKEWSGNQITGMSFGYGSGAQKSVTIFLSEDLNEPPFYTQDVVAKTQRWNDVTLDKPYTITGDKIYVGYYMTTKTTQDYALGFDLNKDDYSQYSGYVSTGATESAIWGLFSNSGDQFGNACIRVRVEGETLPTDRLSVTDFDLPTFSRVGETFSGNVRVLNVGANQIEKFELEYQLGTANPQTTLIKLSTPLGISGKTTAELPGLMFWQEDFECPFKVRVISVNGKEVADPQWVTTTMIISDNVYPRTCVIEEGTGTWCGWCIRGYVGMEYMKDTYGDKSDYIGIAVHSGDAMVASSYSSFVNKYFKGFPSAMANREIAFDPSQESCIEVYNKMTINVLPINVEIVNIQPGADSSYDVTVKTTFTQDLNNIDYGFAIALTEDNVGPYSQSNYYAGSSTVMGGFEKQGDKVNLTYNDVARRIYNWQGAKDCFPANVKAGDVYYYTRQVFTTDLDDVDQSRINVLLIDRNTSAVLTGVKFNFSDIEGVDKVADGIDAVNISAGNGLVYVDGNYDTAEVYALDGTLRASAANEGTIAVAPGMYIVKVMANGVRTVAKVIVK